MLASRSFALIKYACVILFLFFTLLTQLTACGGGSGGAGSAGGPVDSGNVGGTGLTCKTPTSPISVYRANATANSQIDLYSASITGSVVNKITGTLQSMGNATLYAISPNTAYVAYLADQDQDEVFELYVACSDGSTVSKMSGSLVTNGDVQNLKWSPDSSMIAYLADQETDETVELYAVKLQSGIRSKVSGTLVSNGDVAGSHVINGQTESFLWAPDSSAIAYTADQDTDGIYELYVSRADGSSNIKVSGKGIQIFFGVSPDFKWSPDSKYIAYRVPQDVPGVYELYTSTPDGKSNIKVSGKMVAGGQAENSISLTNFFYFPVFKWSPDGSRIAYVADQESDGVFELFTNTPDGANNQKVSLAPMGINGIRTFDWAPNSTLLAYAADQGGIAINVFVTTPAATKNTQLSNASTINGSAFSLHWRPDSQQLIYLADEENDTINNIYIVNADASNKQTIATPTANNFIQGYEWSPDGAYVAYWTDTVQFVGINELYTSKPGGNLNVKVTGVMQGSYGLVTMFQWSPDSSRLVYVADQDVAYKQEMYTTTPDSSINIVKISGVLPLFANVGVDFMISN